MPLSVVVLAAGQGKRMRSARPKVLHRLGGRPLLAHVLERARELGPAAIHVVYGHGGTDVPRAFPDAALRWCLQAEQLGTGHAVAQAIEAIPDDHDVVVLCGDVPLIRAKTLRRLVKTAGHAELAFLTARVPDPAGYGRIVRNAAGAVARIAEHKEATDEELAIDEINTGLLRARAGALRRWLGQLSNDNAQGEYYLTDVAATAFAEGASVAGVLVDNAIETMGINDKKQLAAAERSLQETAAADLLERGATLADPRRVDIRGTLEIGEDVFIDINAVFIGEVTLGDGVQIGPNTVIKDSKLGAGTLVNANSIVEGATTGSSCRIGPFARIRPGTELADRVSIGNFVETKNSRVGDDSKINHLSYIGDTTIGASVNVGAGTITCNYDGVSKHRTTIGDRAFIGSGVNLVAPVEIGAGATIGAGSTISKDAPPEELSIARSRQATVPGWKRPPKAPK